MRFSKSQKNQHDINTVLSVIHALEPYLIKNQQYQDPKGDLEENVRLSTEATFHNATTKLDALISRIGDRREEDLLEEAELKLCQEQIALTQEFKETQKALRRPSTVLQPEIGKHKSGKWAVFYGNIASPDDLIVGLGDSVEQAMADFDKAYSEKLPPKKGKTK